MREEELTALHRDALRELGNIGTSHAATALSILLNCRVDLYPPRCFVMTLPDASQVFQNADEVSVGIFQKLNGSLEGLLLVVFSRAEAMEILNLMLGEDGQVRVFGEMERSTLSEVGNILGGSFITALSQMTGLVSLPDVPNCMVDLAGTIWETAIVEFAGVDEKIIFVETNFSARGVDVAGRIFFLPNLNSVKNLFTTLGL